MLLLLSLQWVYCCGLRCCTQEPTTSARTNAFKLAAAARCIFPGRCWPGRPAPATVPFSQCRLPLGLFCVSAQFCRCREPARQQTHPSADCRVQTRVIFFQSTTPPRSSLFGHSPPEMTAQKRKKNARALLPALLPCLFK